MREAPALPTFMTPLELLEYALRNVYVLDILRRDDIPPAVASRALWGILGYNTVATHLYHLHGQCSALLARVSERLLNRMHPLHCMLLPTELGTTDVLVRGVPSLLTVRGMFVQCFPWTFD